MAQSSEHATIDVVQKELESTLQSAESSLGRFIDDRDSGEDLQNCIDCLNQLRGIFVVVEIRGATTLCEEAVKLATEIPVGAAEDKNGLLSSLSDAVFMLKNYTEYLGKQKTDFPELLLGSINQLRIAQKTPVFGESHFHSIDPHKKADLLAHMSLEELKPLSDFTHHAPRFRHMYQVALLDLLRGENTDIAFKMMQRACEGSARLCMGYGLAPFWMLIELLASEFGSRQVEVTDSRKRLFMRIERHLKDMAQKGQVAADIEPAKELVNEIVFLLGVVESDDARAEALLDDLALSPRYTEQQRVEHEAKLFGPGNQVFESLSEAINEELMQLKEKLDLFERGTHPEEEEISFVAEGLGRLSGILTMLSLPNLSANCREQSTAVAAWSESGHELSEDDLISTANTVLGVEAAIRKYSKEGQDVDHVLQEHDDSSHYLAEARSLVVEESQGSLALTKRSITAYIESGGDKLHLANIASSLDSSRGGMFLMGRERVAEVLSVCLNCIKAELIESQSMPDEKLLETLADALSSLEYYIEGIGAKGSSNEELLKLSEESLKSIGYESAA
jgi:scaffold protein FimL